MKIKNIQEFLLLNEGFILKDNTFVFDSDSDEIINTKFGIGKNHKPRIMKLPLGIAYAIYNNGTGDDSLRKELLLAIKGKGKYKIDTDSYTHFINRSVLYFVSKIKEYNFDLILTMESKSPLLNDISNRLKQYLTPGQLIMNYSDAEMLYKDGVKKVKDFTKININRDKLSGTKPLSDSAYDSFVKLLHNMVDSGYFEMKKIPQPIRKGFENYLEVNNNFISKINGKKILLIEDFITSGESLKEASRKLQNAGADDLLALCLIKSS